MTIRSNPILIREVTGSSDFNASDCMNCGCCTAICPMETGILARKLFRYVMLGLEDKIKENSEIIFSCLLCKLCEEACPADVHIADNMRIIRHYLDIHVYGL